MFFVAERGSYGFLVRPNTLLAYPIALNGAEIAELVNKLRDTTVAKPGGLPTPDLEASYRLYKALFGPVEQQLAGVAKISVAAGGGLMRHPPRAPGPPPRATAGNRDYRPVPFLVPRAPPDQVPGPPLP